MQCNVINAMYGCDVCNECNVFNVCMYVWMDGWIDGCMHVYVCMSMYVCMNEWLNERNECNVCNVCNVCM